MELCQHVTTADKYVKIFSDYQAALKAFGDHKIKSHLVGQAVREINMTAAIICSFQLDQIKAHAKLKGNERADKLARNQVYATDIIFDLQPPMTLFKQEI